MSVEDVATARGGPGWFQLYTVSDWPATERMLKRAEDDRERGEGECKNASEQRRHSHR